MNLPTSDFQKLPDNGPSTAHQLAKKLKSKKKEKERVKKLEINKKGTESKSKKVCSGGVNCFGSNKYLHTSNNCLGKEIICEGCKELGHNNDKCPKALKNISCSKCKQGGHTEDKCQSPFCYKCFKFGHQGKNCFVKPCDGCKEPGHNKNKCPNKKALCMNCNGKGHFSDKCAFIIKVTPVLNASIPLKKDQPEVFIQQPTSKKSFKESGAKRYDKKSQIHYGDQVQQFHPEGNFLPFS